MRTVTQRPNTHVFYDVDWGPWLKNRGYASTDIVSVTWSVASGAATITKSTLSGTKARVWVTGLGTGKTATITAFIILPTPTGTTVPVSDSYSFQILCENR